MLEQVFSCQKKRNSPSDEEKIYKEIHFIQWNNNKTEFKAFFLLWKENEWWRHMLRLFIHIYGVFHSVQLYTRLRTKYFTMDRNWMNIVKKSNNFLLLLFSELICDEKRNMTSFSCQSSIYSFLTHPNITLFSAFFAFFYSHSLIVSIMFGMCAQCAFTCIRLNGTRGIFFV